MGWTFYNSNGQRLSTSTTLIDNLDIDGATDIGAAIVDADLFIIDDGAGGTNRKTAASRIETYTALKSTIVTGERTASAGSGAQAITGAGFAPTTLIIWATQKTVGEDVASWGFGDDGVVDENMAASQGTMQFDTPSGGLLVNLDDGTADSMTAVLTSLDADGCTITWTKGGSGMDAAWTILFLR
jgi:hypothetical protein